MSRVPDNLRNLPPNLRDEAKRVAHGLLRVGGPVLPVTRAAAARHEAGHCIVGAAFGRRLKRVFIQRAGAEWQGGTYHHPPPGLKMPGGMVLASPAEMFGAALVILAGPLGERVGVPPGIGSTWAADAAELVQVREGLVTLAAMAQRPGGALPADMPPDFDFRAAVFFATASKATKRLLMENMGTLDRLAARIETKRRLAGHEAGPTLRDVRRADARALLEVAAATAGLPRPPDTVPDFYQAIACRDAPQRGA
ncbi:hypothetical protein AAFN86_28795 [Roseomonas sp. CAU 1739]|uniref:hypothetical protein n=1 Tax=Roseomonas sp. CAU 1739 TaxID=3140364 RepID=UPI00325C0D12